MNLIGGARLKSGERGDKSAGWAQGTLQRNAGRFPYADLVLAAMILCIVFMMIVPLPTLLLDLLIGSNIALSVLMLLSAIYGGEGLAFASMPSALLIGTLYRLALNVSSTRLILLDAHAGEVIGAFGDFVVRGDYVVGAVIFVILTIIQFLVIAKGAERVAEVGARFALDAMPGKQLAVDSEVRAGQLGPEQARQARRELHRESQFYGAMDGAMKFVKGDALAALLIVGIDLAAGVYIGTSSRGLTFVESLQTYGLLTIGDGLSCQLPSLLMSTSAGIVVTRVAGANSSDSLGQSLATQLLSQTRTLRIAGLFVLILGAIPALPWLPFTLLGLGLLGLSWTTRQDSNHSTSVQHPAPVTRPLQVRLGPSLFEMSSDDKHATAEALRNGMFARLGLPIPTLDWQRRENLPDSGYQILIHELPAKSGELHGEDQERRSQLERELTSALNMKGHHLLDLQTVQDMVDALERDRPAQVRGIVPSLVPLSDLTDLLRRLVSEQVSIRPLGEILEFAATLRASTPTLPSAELYERVRLHLGRRISHSHASSNGTLTALVLDPFVEETLKEHTVHSGGHTALALGPELATPLLDALASRLEGSGEVPVSPTPVVITTAELRPLLRDLLKTRFPLLPVLGYQELDPELELTRLEPISA